MSYWEKHICACFSVENDWVICLYKSCLWILQYTFKEYRQICGTTDWPGIGSLDSLGMQEESQLPLSSSTLTPAQPEIQEQFPRMLMGEWAGDWEILTPV